MVTDVGLVRLVARDTDVSVTGSIGVSKIAVNMNQSPMWKLSSGSDKGSVVPPIGFPLVVSQLIVEFN